MPSTWAGDNERKPAPGELRRLQALINTVDLESGQDRLARAEDARPWLVDNGLLTANASVGSDDLGVLVEIREALRALAIHNTSGVQPAPVVVEVLNQVAAAGAVHAAIDCTGRVELGAAGDSVRARLVALLLILRDAQRDGSWAHLKACSNEACQWAFYDRSRNHGGTWCDMSTCGNKLKNRDFRARRRGAPV